MANRTQIVCLHEGVKGKSIDPIFINRLIRSLKPSWIKPWGGSNLVRLVPCGGRKELIGKLPDSLREVNSIGGNTTLMVWADMDDDITDGDELKKKFWIEAQEEGVDKESFDRVVFIFAKDRIENWIQFLNTGATDESSEGPRLGQPRDAADAARKLANLCLKGAPILDIPPSLAWSCRNWRILVERLR